MRSRSYVNIPRKYTNPLENHYNLAPGTITDCRKATKEDIERAFGLKNFGGEVTNHLLKKAKRYSCTECLVAINVKAAAVYAAMLAGWGKPKVTQVVVHGTRFAWLEFDNNTHPIMYVGYLEGDIPKDFDNLPPKDLIGRNWKAGPYRDYEHNPDPDRPKKNPRGVKRAKRKIGLLSERTRRAQEM